jgi:hypothetical protein
MQNIIFSELLKVTTIPAQHPSDILLLQFSDDDQPLPDDLQTHEFFDPQLKEEHIFFDFMDPECSSCGSGLIVWSDEIMTMMMKTGSPTVATPAQSQPALISRL